MSSGICDYRCNMIKVSQNILIKKTKFSIRDTSLNVSKSTVSSNMIQLLKFLNGKFCAVI